MALDIGDVRVGIAVSDPLNIVANPRETYMSTKDFDTDVNYFINYAKKENCDTIVIGLPMNMDGTHGEMVDKVKKFGQRRDKRKKVIDKVAATIIFEAYSSKNKI